MGKRTGQPRGRPAGTKNYHTVKRELRINEAAEVIAKVLPRAFKGDAHALLMAVYKDETLTLEVRLDAAKASIPYEKPRLAAVAHSADKNSQFALAILTAVPEPDDVAETGANDDGISATAH